MSDWVLGPRQGLSTSLSQRLRVMGTRNPQAGGGSGGSPREAACSRLATNRRPGFHPSAGLGPYLPPAEGSLLSAEEAKRIGGRLASLPLPQGAPFPTLPFPALPSSLNPTPVPPQAFCSPPPPPSALPAGVLGGVREDRVSC